VRMSGGADGLDGADGETIIDFDGGGAFAIQLLYREPAFLGILSDHGVFASTERPYDLPLIEDPKQVAGGVEFEEKFAKERQELEKHIDAEFAKLTENFRQRIGDYLVRAATTEPDITETTQFALSLSNWSAVQ